MRILFDKNVPVGVRRFLAGHEVHTFVEMNWPPQLENGGLLKMAETAAFDVMITSDQNIRYQQNLGLRFCATRLVSGEPPAGNSASRAIFSTV